MSDLVTAAPQPQQSTAAPGGETTAKNEVGQNMTGSSVRAMLLQRDLARQTATAPAEVQSTAPETSAEPATTQPAEEATQTATETEQQTADAPEGDPDAAADNASDVLSQLSSLDPKTRAMVQQAIEAQRKKDQESVNKRLGKEVWRRKNLESQLQEAQGRLQQAPQNQPAAPPPAYDSAQPLSDIQDPASLQKRADEAKRAVREANDLLDREDIDWARGLAMGDKVWTRADVREARRNAQIILEDHVPQRAAFFQQRDQVVRAAVEKYPFLKDPESAGYIKAQAIVANPQFAWLKTIPNAAEILGGYVEGELAQEARKKTVAPAKPAALIRPRPSNDQTVSTAVGAGSERSTSGARQTSAVAAELSRLNAKGNVTGRELRDFLKKSDQLR